MNKFLAIIPARAGSKRLPRKNLLDLHGKPLVVWTIEAAQNSHYIDSVYVSSDDEAIIAIANRLQAKTITRPAELARDTSTTFDAINHTIGLIAEQYEYIVLLQPTSPLRTAQHIDEGVLLLNEKSADAIVSVSVAEHSPLWSNTLPPDKSMNGFLPKKALQRGQDLPVYYRLNGAIYICRTDRLLAERSFFLPDNIYAYVMEKKDSVDIDDEVDFEFAQALLSKRIE